MNEITSIQLDLIDPSPWQGRLLDTIPVANDDEINPFEAKAFDELVRSIEGSGLMQPITVRPKGTRYELVDGHRRLMAHQKLGLQTIKAIVTDYTDREAQTLSLVANMQRKNLNTIELAMAFQKILDAQIFADKRELSQAVGKDETYVGDILNTLRMDTRIVEHLARTNTIKDPRILRTIRKAAPLEQEGGADKQWELYQLVVQQSMSRNQLADYLKSKDNRIKIKPAWNFKFSSLNLNIKLKTGRLSPENRKKLEEILNLKLMETIQEIEQDDE
jgi:ParB/RepB/Spo0J family partition protein